MASTKKFKESELPYLKNLKVPYGMIKKQYTPEEFLIEYFNKGRVATYAKDGQLQCGKGRYRSFIDLHYIMKSKFPTIDIKETAYLYLKLYTLGWNKRVEFYYYNGINRSSYINSFLSISYCNTVRKVVTSKWNESIDTRKRNCLAIINNGKFEVNSKNPNIEYYISTLTKKGIDGFSLTLIMDLANKWIKLNNIKLKYGDN